MSDFNTSQADFGQPDDFWGNDDTQVDNDFADNFADFSDDSDNNFINTSDNNDDDDFWLDNDSQNQEVNQNNQSDDFWGTDQDNQNTQQDDFWGNEQVPQDNQQGNLWGEEQQVQQNSQQDDFWNNDNTQVNNQNTQTDNDSKVKQVIGEKVGKFGYKTVGLIIAGVFIVLMLLFIIVSKVHIVSNDEPKQPVESAEIEAPNNNLTLIDVPDSTSINYNGDVLEALASVIDKTKYVYEGQVIYCVELSVLGNKFRYFCNYDSFLKVAVGDTLSITYQQVSDGCISINNISK